MCNSIHIIRAMCNVLHIVFYDTGYRITMEVNFMGYDHRVMGKVLRTVREKKRKSQDVISGFAGIDRTHLTKIECGQHSASMETLWHIAEALEVPLSELVRLVEEEIENQK